ncbi:MAG: alkaline phosphatase family protein [Bryobacteraceae bacterium]
MSKFLALILMAGSLLSAAPKKPKLVVAIVIDQFRYDYLTRYRSDYHGGFDLLLTKGAVFTNARYQHFPTVTGVGHSIFLSGAMPALSGIVANAWYDREAGLQVTCVSDPQTSLVGGLPGPGSSPRRMLVDTVGDELKIADDSQSRVIGISLKDRAAILPAGHMANGAYWFDGRNGNFVSSSYYFEDVPAWVKEANEARPADRYAGKTWLGHQMPDPGQLYSAIEATPYGNEIVEAFAERALAGEQLGQRGVTDLLAVSFSSNDYVGHAYGPDSPEARAISADTDELLAKFFGALDRAVGLGNVLVVVTADHGVAPVPEVNTARHMPGGRMEDGIIAKTVQETLGKKYGQFDWVTATLESVVYLNHELIAFKKLDLAEVERTAAEALREVPHVFRVYTGVQLADGQAMQDSVGHMAINGYFPRRGADLEVLTDPYWIIGGKGTTHGLPFGYDTHVPVIFLGSGIRAGEYDNNITPNDIAPTLSTILRVETPSGSFGRVLVEMFAQ